MHIAFLTDGIFPFVMGGMQKHSTNTIVYLAQQGYSLTIVHTIYDKRPMPSEEEVKQALGIENFSTVRVIGIRFPPAGMMPGHYIKESYQFSRWVYESIQLTLDRFDLIYAKGFSAWYLLSQKKKVKLPPVIVKFHGYEMFQRPAGLKSKLEHWLLRGPVRWNTLNADYVMSYGGKITEIIKSIGVPENRILEVPTGIDRSWIKTESLQAHSTRTFLFLGRWERRKGIEEWTEVIREQGSNGTFYFIGPIPASKRLKQDNVTYFGEIKEVDRIREIMDECDVLVVPSWSEGMPNVILEGMSRGLAVIATNVGAVGALVDDKNGWLVEKCDKKLLIVALSEAMQMETSALQRLKAQSIHRIEVQFIKEIVFEKLQGHLRNILALP